MKKILFKTMYFTFDSFNLENFNKFIMENFKVDSTYSILVSLGFKGNSVFYMSGKQIGIKVGSVHDLVYYENVYNIIISRIYDVMFKYDVEYIPDTIIIRYKIVHVPEKLIIKNIHSVSLEKSLISKSESQEVLSSKYLPLSISNKHFGFLIQGVVKDNYISNLINKISFVSEKIPDYLQDKNLLKLSSVFIRKTIVRKNSFDILIIEFNLKDFVSYLRSDQGISIDSKYTNFLDYDYKESYLRFVYDINTGICLFEALDFLTQNSKFIRNINNFQITLFEDKIIKLSRKVKLNSITPPRTTPKYMSNPNIGVLDLETFTNSKNEGQVYSLGFATLSDMDKLNTYYLTDLGQCLNSNFLVINCIDAMLDVKYHNYYWYIHNMGRFDIIYIHKCLEEFNLLSKSEYYKLDSTYKDGKMLRLIVRRKLSNKNYIKITFLDSINLLNDSLSNLTKEFNTTTSKGTFPYSFVNEQTLNYIGPTPDIKYYSNISVEEYNNLFKDTWNLKEESLSYLKQDILGLLEVLDKFKTKLFLEHNLELTEGLTISRLALNKYLRFYLNDYKIPLINKIDMFNFIYLGYFGGRTEVFKPYGQNLYYYDINSLYPSVALEDMVGIECKHVKSFLESGLDIKNIFGVFKATVKTNNQYLGLLPVKSSEGLIFPSGEYEGIWPSPELELAKALGYQIKITEGYNFNKVPSYFKNYILDLYDLKSKTKGVEKRINKSLLNNLLGRFGLNIVKPITKLIKGSELDSLITTRKIKSIQEITSDTFLVTYEPLIDLDVCLEHNVNYLSVLEENKNKFNIEKNVDIFEDVSVIISALVTSYARVFMLKIMLEITKKGGIIYYTDTDSIVLDKPIETYLPNIVGDGLGQFKLEYFIKEGYFISNKTYCLILENGDSIIKCKGVINNSLTLEDFKQMYYSATNVEATKRSSIKNLNKGYVIIEDKKIILQHNAYRKRHKIFDSKGLWIDTKSLVINNISKDIVPV